MSETTLEGGARDHIAPLPIRVRRVYNESMDSYIRRLASANGVTAVDVGRWLRESAILPRELSKATWYAAWARLGDLPPKSLPGDPGPGVDRALCRRCSHGQRVEGRMPAWGLICLRHGCWIDPADGSSMRQTELRAERAFRRTLSSSGLHMESPGLQFALRLASLAVSPDWLDARTHRHGFRSLRASLFPAQVRIAADLFRHDELAALRSTEPGRRLESCERWLACRIAGLGERDEPWRAAGILSALLQHLEDRTVVVELEEILYRFAR